MAGNVYSIKKNRIERGYHPGLRVSEEGTLTLCQEEGGGHYLYLRPVDGAEQDASWGRLSFQADCGEDIVYYLHVFALNEDSFFREGRPVRIEDFLCDPAESHGIKKEFLRRVGAVRYTNQCDVLLYTFQGRYLYLVLEVAGEGPCSISHIRLDTRGDNFMDTFPEIYRERNGFFHRYMSVFSSIYEDFQGEIDRLPDLLDLDTCPAHLLPAYGKWLGLDVGEDFLEESVLRSLVKEAYQLNRMKGTRRALERLTEIVLGEKAKVLERNVVADHVSKEQMAEFERLFGNSVYDVTILVSKELTEAQKSQLVFLLNQFKPIRTQLHVIQLRPAGVLDSYSFLDVNARVPRRENGSLDDSQELSEGIQLQ